MKLEPQTHCTAFWRGRERRFALALFDGFVHFWEPDSPKFQAAPEEWVWVIEGEIKVCERCVVNPRFLRASFEAALERGAFGRLLHLHSGRNIFVGAFGTGEFCASHPSEQASFRFEIERIGELLT